MNRRELVVGGSLVVAVDSLPIAAAVGEDSRAIVTQPAPIRVAIISTGGWGLQHARVYAERSDARIVAIVGCDPGRTQERAAAYRANPYTEIDRMLREERPDFVSVCVSNEAHYSTALQLIRAGGPLLVEKPLTFELPEADQLLDLDPDETQERLESIEGLHTVNWRCPEPRTS